MNKGIVYLVGAGPGDPKLITIHGMECIQKADVIAYDRLINKELLNYAKPDAELIFCGKAPGYHSYQQEEINAVLVEHALAGKIVTRLKGGDPSVFGRVGEEAEALREHGILYKIIPGITAGIAAPAYAGIPVTYRHLASTFTIVTAHGKQEKEVHEINWEALAKGSDTIAFYMGVKNLPTICTMLMKYGRGESTPVAVIQWGTYEHQRTVVGNLLSIEAIVERNKITHPAIIVVGEVVKLRETLAWFEEEAIVGVE